MCADAVVFLLDVFRIDFPSPFPSSQLGIRRLADPLFFSRKAQRVIHSFFFPRLASTIAFAICSAFPFSPSLFYKGFRILASLSTERYETLSFFFFLIIISLYPLFVLLVFCFFFLCPLLLIFFFAIFALRSLAPSPQGLAFPLFLRGAVPPFVSSPDRAWPSQTP